MLTPITITGLIVNPNGALASGGMTFQLGQGTTASNFVPIGMTDSSSGEVVTPAPISAVINNGRLLSNATVNLPPLVLLATDDTTTEPNTGLCYLVTEQLVIPPGGAQVGPWLLTVSHLAPAGTINIGSQRPIP